MPVPHVPTGPAPWNNASWANANLVLPRGVAQDFIGRIEQQSIAMQLGRTMRMSAATESIPVIAFRPTAKFVSPMYGGRKPVTEIRWTAKEIVPEEVACVLPVPNAWMQDANFDVEGQVEREMANAVAWTLDQAMIFGIDRPASYPVGGVLGFADTVNGRDALDAIDQGMEVLEKQGVSPDGIGSGAAIGSGLRQAYREAKALPGVAPSDQLYGVPVRRSLNWDLGASAADAVIGGWQYLAIGIREDVTFGESNDGVIFSDTGQLVASAFQDNVTLVKIHARIGCAIGQPMQPGPGAQPLVKPFVAAEWSSYVPPTNGDSGADPESQAARSRTRRTTTAAE
jgi:hypothetical protein